jgi:hypothetical protein
MLFYVSHDACQSEHPVWDIGLELSGPREYNNRPNRVFWQDLKQITSRADMLEVLVYGVLEPMPGPKVHLRPVPISWPAEYSAAIVLGLNHKYSEARDQDVTDLRGVAL